MEAEVGCDSTKRHQGLGASFHPPGAVPGERSRQQDSEQSPARRHHPHQEGHLQEPTQGLRVRQGVRRCPDSGRRQRDRNAGMDRDLQETVAACVPNKGTHHPPRMWYR